MPPFDSKAPAFTSGRFASAIKRRPARGSAAAEPLREHIQLAGDDADLKFVGRMTIEGIEIAIRHASDGHQVARQTDFGAETPLVLDSGLLLESLEVVFVILPRRRSRVWRREAVARRCEAVDAAG